MAHYTLIARINAVDGRFPFVNVGFSKNHRPAPIEGATYYLRPSSGGKRTPIKIGKDVGAAHAAFNMRLPTVRCSGELWAIDKEQSRRKAFAKFCGAVVRSLGDGELNLRRRIGSGLQVVGEAAHHANPCRIERCRIGKLRLKGLRRTNAKGNTMRDIGKRDAVTQ